VALELVVGSAVGAGVLYMWGWRRLKYVAGSVRRHKRASEFEQLLRAGREDLAVANPYRAATADDTSLVTKLAIAQPHHESLVACGFSALGDVIVIGTDRLETAVLRTLVDHDGTTSALIVVGLKDPSVAILQLSSFGDDATWSTRIGNHVSLAAAPTVNRQTLPATLPHSELVAKHQAFARGSLIRIQTRDDLLVQLNKSRADAIRWRSAQAPDELLDADLRVVLGDAYPRFGKVWMRRLRGRLPQATLRR
jgi:hypothetical protein